MSALKIGGSMLCMLPAALLKFENMQHAVHAVLRERAQLQGSEHAAMSCVARHHLRLEYSKTYARHQRSKTW